MKIVKMHKGSREAFDDFLAQRLNEVEVDNDTADKYFADMNLPLPVIPVTKTFFLSKHKNKLWLLLLLFITSFSTYLFVNTKSNKKIKQVVEKSKYLQENVDDNVIIPPNKIADKEFISNNKNEEKEIKSVAKINNIDDGLPVKLRNVKSNFISKNKITPPNKMISKSINYLDTSIIINKKTELLFDKKISLKLAPTNILKTLQDDKKKPSADSLYIIW